MIDQHRQSLRAAGKSSARDDLPFLSIAIFGPSGSGKSSLLRTLVRDVNDAGIRPDRDDPKCSIHALPVMQPDRFAEHDHFLYAFLATALEEEKERREDRQRQRDESHTRREQRYEPDALSPVQQRFQDLSDYLRVIDEPEKSRDYDPLGLSLERLERHTSALRLKDRMRSFIDSLANELAGRSGGGLADSIVLMPVDDADMSPQHLVTSLQIYQTYLLHSRLVPVFTFTDRTAEELLRGYFHRHLLPVPDGASGGVGVPMTYDSPGEGTRRLPVGDQLALQYLARCFPVRNRIRLGPAPARFRERCYEVSDGAKEKREPQSVRALLLTASHLLYGAASREAKNPIRTVLRPSTLRRQVHVVDEMFASGVESLWPDEESKETAKKESRTAGSPESNGAGDGKGKRLWVRIFDRAAWSLMNVHRDVLREYQLYLEDLYSWTGEGLRRILLETILSQPIEARRALLHRWRFRLSSRRAETLSILAANVFRPWMPGEEPTGEVGISSNDVSRALLCGETEARKQGLPAANALLWFLDLLNGFYQPQVLAWNRPNDIAAANPQKGRVGGLGWNLESGPVNAIRAAEANDSVATAGMLFLDPYKYSCALDWSKDSKTPDQDAALLLRCWTYCGYSRGRYWAALSFWRGLSLIGQLLRARRRFDLEKVRRLAEQDEPPTGEWDTLALDDDDEQRLQKTVQGILRNHLIRGLVPGQLVGEGETEGRLDLAFRRWDRTRIGSEGGPAEGLERDLVEWVKALNRLPEGTGAGETKPLVSQRCGDLIALMPTIDERKEEQLRSSDGQRQAWNKSLLRRLHGDDIVGSLLSRMNATFIDDHDLFGMEVRFEGEVERRRQSGAGEPKPHRRLWSAGIAMTTWTRIFLDYWRGLAPMQDLLRSCPLMMPFAEGPSTDRFRDGVLRRIFRSGEQESPISERTLRDRLASFGPEENEDEAVADSNESSAGLQDEKIRFRSRLGSMETPGRQAVQKTPGETYGSWLEQQQKDAFRRALPDVSLFYAVARVRSAEFKPEQPISVDRTTVVVDGPVPVSLVRSGGCCRDEAPDGASHAGSDPSAAVDGGGAPSESAGDGSD